uniref:Jacalin-type lectin domain-containing protein n=1 Tax=Nelumbo nucifera TaxID=4432 RepID=A0A822YBL9_NELNU|nr:TPA_asm: hypothetical protein HUJ06_030981 [Nelumbo nucifera]
METIEEGPFGGEGGDSWEYLPPMDRGITRIIIRYDGEVIRSIKFGSVDADRRRYVYSDAFGDEV